MRNIQIIEALYDSEEKYQVIHDFGKEEVSEEEISNAMFDVISNIREGVSDITIKDSVVFCIELEDGVMTYVHYMIDIWDNMPLDLMNAFYEDRENIKEFVNDFYWFIASGFLLDSPFDGGSGLFDHLEIEWN